MIINSNVTQQQVAENTNISTVFINSYPYVKVDDSFFSVRNRRYCHYVPVDSSGNELKTNWGTADSFKICINFRLDTVSSSYMFLFGAGDSQSAFYTPTVWISSNQAIGTDWSTNGTSWNVNNISFSNGIIETGKWYYYLFSYDKTLGSRTIYLYDNDGKLIQTKSSDVDSFYSVNQTCCIGGQCNLNSTKFSQGEITFESFCEYNGNIIWGSKETKNKLSGI